MTDPSYLGLPSPLYLERIAAGYRDWGLPESALGRAVRETRIELERLGEPVSFGAPRTTNRV